MNLLQNSKDLTNEQIYAMTHSQSANAMKEAVDHVLTVGAYVIYENENNEGDMMACCAILDSTTKQIFVTNSGTFIKSFSDMVKFIDESKLTIKVISKTTKNGRPYINCELVA